jgi:hypothetical protein
MKALVLALIGLAVVAGMAGAAGTKAHKAGTFNVTRVQAEEIAAVVGFLDAYNSGDMKASLRYFDFPKHLSSYEADGATDCDYRRQTTRVFYHRKGVVRWLKQRFADRDRLTLGRILDLNPAQPIGVVGVDYVRRTSDTLRKLGFPKGIVPQVGQKLPFRFKGGVVKFQFFGLASTHVTTPKNTECELVPYRG